MLTDRQIVQSATKIPGLPATPDCRKLVNRLWVSSGALRQESGLAREEKSTTASWVSHAQLFYWAEHHVAKRGLSAENPYSIPKPLNIVRKKAGRSDGRPSHACVIPHRIGARIGGRGS